MAPAVHQFHQTIGRGDAISEEMLAWRDLLREAGYESEIFVEQVPEALSREVRSLASYSGDPNGLLLVHHSIGHHSAAALETLPDRKVLVYHNVTPERFFLGNEFMANHMRLGREQLRFFRRRVAVAFADSEYNGAELRRLGYKDVRAIPPIFGMRRLDPPAVPDPAADREPLVLFVGRFAPNKRQEDVVEAFERFARRVPRGKLLLAGGWNPHDSYTQFVMGRIERSPVADSIRAPGAVSDAELSALYRRASVYLSMSEHEGFGLPLLEAFFHGVPVLAYDAAAVAETMGGAGVLFRRKDMESVAAMMEALSCDRDLRQRIVRDQSRRLERADLTGATDRFLQAIDDLLRKPRRRSAARVPASLSIQIQGPFETTYGLAVANRLLAEALDRHTGHAVSIYATEGPGDYLPRSRDLADKPEARRLWERSFVTAPPDVVIRNTYPPRFDTPTGTLNLSLFFWEDSLLPFGWAEKFNRHFDGVLAPSTHVRDVMRASGVELPIEWVPPPVEPLSREPVFPRELAGVRRAQTTFLSVGSAFPRKGVDVLVSAFADAFRAGDDVRLIIKSFPNPHNTVAQQLAALRARDRDAPSILHVDRDLPPAEMLGLYRAADAFVHPARAEGFGLPVAEAMLLGLPVIATAAGGLADFCRDETAFVVPHRMRQSESHVQVPGAQWAEPDEKALATLLRGFASGRLKAEAERRAEAARRFVRSEFSSSAVARRADEAIRRLARTRPARLRVGYLSTWRTRCGIASYTEDLLNNMPGGGVEARIFANTDSVGLRPDGNNVRRAWGQVQADYLGIANAALESDLDLFHVQFHPGLFAEYAQFARLLLRLHERGLPVVATLHLLEEVNYHGKRQRPELLAEALRTCRKLIVHGEIDRWRLAALGIEESVEHVPHGGTIFPIRRREKVALELGVFDRRLIASFGYAFPHKGFLETIEATAILRERFPNILFIALAARRPEASSAEYLARCRDRIGELGLETSVWLIDAFLPVESIGRILSAAEVALFPYGTTAESASGAVRFPLAAGRATITTRQPIFEDVREAVLQVSEPSPQLLAEAATRILLDERLRADLEQRARRFARRRLWSRIARRHLEIYAEVLKDRSRTQSFPRPAETAAGAARSLREVS